MKENRNKALSYSSTTSLPQDLQKIPVNHQLSSDHLLCSCCCLKFVLDSHPRLLDYFFWSQIVFYSFLIKKHPRGQVRSWHLVLFGNVANCFQFFLNQAGLQLVFLQYWDLENRRTYLFTDLLFSCEKTILISFMVVFVKIFLLL